LLESDVNILKIENLRKEFTNKVTKKPIVAVDNISLSLERGKTLGIVGESGSGKSTLGRIMLRLVEPTSGKIVFNGADITDQKPTELRKLRSRMQMIFQDPMASLDPRMSVRELIQEPLDIHNIGSKAERSKAVEDIAEKVGIAKSALEKFPHEFSGGQRQRISIARAVINKPDLIIADEPVSALDVSIQAQILNLLKELRRELNLSFIFISHDLSVVNYFCDEVAVMYLGNIVEFAPTAELFANPKHPYTQALISAIPEIDTENKAKRIILTGDVPNPADAPSGCHFHPRCPLAIASCATQTPTLKKYGTNHQVSCNLVGVNA
jgi:oligopeptide/dipeptide ABC transporter ATP-binding protein